MSKEERKEKMLLELEAKSLEQVQDMLLHVVAFLSVITIDEPSPKAIANKHRFEAVSCAVSEISGTLKEAQRRLGNAIATY